MHSRTWKTYSTCQFMLVLMHGLFHCHACLRTEGVVRCADCKAPWGKLWFVVLRYINKNALDLTCMDCVKYGKNFHTLIKIHLREATEWTCKRILARKQKREEEWRGNWPGTCESGANFFPFPVNEHRSHFRFLFYSWINNFFKLVFIVSSKFVWIQATSIISLVIHADNVWCLINFLSNILQ